MKTLVIFVIYLFAVTLTWVIYRKRLVREYAKNLKVVVPDDVDRQLGLYDPPIFHKIGQAPGESHWRDGPTDEMRAWAARKLADRLVHAEKWGRTWCGYWDVKARQGRISHIFFVVLLAGFIALLMTSVLPGVTLAITRKNPSRIVAWFWTHPLVIQVPIALAVFLLEGKWLKEKLFLTSVAALGAYSGWWIFLVLADLAMAV